ncbi:hypothetical protein EYF80_010734 [Liparis tanakae]|uniref:Uncharacterized protein n=1 Tax=Liparis tanakae TaxID=230148 RepID=A0A4Z2IMH2_9TELE|nr:hypothetical protein EYF80_010734 [Liparis tanakae]
MPDSRGAHHLTEATKNKGASQHGGPESPSSFGINAALVGEPMRHAGVGRYRMTSPRAAWISYSSISSNGNSSGIQIRGWLQKAGLSSHDPDRRNRGSCLFSFFVCHFHSDVISS